MGTGIQMPKSRQLQRRLYTYNCFFVVPRKTRSTKTQYFKMKTLQTIAAEGAQPFTDP